jgi:hypothetical protein
MGEGTGEWIRRKGMGKMNRTDLCNFCGMLLARGISWGLLLDRCSYGVFDIDS